MIDKPAITVGEDLLEDDAAVPSELVHAVFWTTILCLSLAFTIEHK